jgi:S1-C subfamily serine protease
MSKPSKEMGKKVRATYIAVLEALKAHDCISGYSIIGNGVKLEWKHEGVARALQEVTTNPRPFGLNRSQRGGLLMVLPQKERQKADAVFLDGFKKKYGLGLVLLFLFLTLGVAAAQQTNSLSNFDKLKSRAEAGDVQSQFELCALYVRGDGVPEDKTEAIKWCRRAAEQGYGAAEYNLGLAYLTGDAVPQDYIKAYKWFDLAAAQDISQAIVGRDKLAALMMQSQISEALQLVAAFVPKKEDSSSNSSSPDSPAASGSGFFITDDGYLITNNHVVKDATKIRLVTSAGMIGAKVVHVDAANDLALLKADGKFSPLPITASRAAHLGGTVAMIGFPDLLLQGFAPKLAKGEIASLSGIQDDPRYFQISVPVQPGNSGGALVDERGNVIGIVSAKLDASAALAASGALPENVNYAVKSSLLLSFLESVPVVSAKLKAPNTADEKFEDVVKSAQAAAVLVLVY